MEETNELSFLEYSVNNQVVNVIPYTFLHNYHPASERPIISKNEKKIQDRIYVMKKNYDTKNKQKTINDIAEEVSEYINSQIENKNELMFLCIPTSSKKSYEKRYEKLSKIITEKTGLTNANPYVRITYSKKPKHYSNYRNNYKSNYCLDQKFFKDKKVIVFDDVITSGNSALMMNKHIIGCNAKTELCLFYAKTTKISNVTI